MMIAPLPPPVPGEPIDTQGPAGRVTLHASGKGPPLLLVHSINAAASAAEMRPLQEFYAATRRVYCIDLPGYGFSERSLRPYSPRLMTDAIHQAIAHIRSHGNEPIDALALSLSSEYLARAATESSEFFRSVALVSPTGFQAGRDLRAPAGTSRGIPWVFWILTTPGWGRSIFKVLTHPKSIRYFLGRTWGSKHIDENLWRYDILTAKQPGAEHAPLRFLSGFLFSADIHAIYEKLDLPVWMSHGVRGDFTDYENQHLLAKLAHWDITPFDTGALPYFERTEEFCARYSKFMDEPKHSAFQESPPLS
jgi:pimeloyl-ACP methyl ester carboxylesterase